MRDDSSIDAVEGWNAKSPGAERDSRLSQKSRRSRLNDRRTEIIRVFAELGFVDLLVKSGLWEHAPAGFKARRSNAGASGQPDQPARLRRAFEQLEGAFVKFGQMLSVRPDLIPPEYVAELEKLQDDLPPMPLETVRQVIESELECPLEEAFASFSPSPLGSASISQVHGAELQDGTEVVVKVQRPDAPTLIDLDLELMTRAASRLSRTPWAEEIDLVGTVAEFADAVRSELDFAAEARNLDCFSDFFSEDETVEIPVAYWDHSTSRVLTQSRLKGIPLNRPEDIREAGGDTRVVVEHGVDAYLQMVFELRRFHSDPHPGNLLALHGDEIGFIDFGRVSTLSERALDRSADCLIAFVRNDAASVTDAVLEMTHAGPEVDRGELRLEIEVMMDRYARADVAHTMGPSMMSETLEITRRHHLHMPSEYAMLFQTLGVLQGVVLNLDPDTQLLNVMEPHIKRVVLKRSPERISREVFDQVKQYGNLMARLPGALDSILRHLDEGELGVRIRVDESEEVLDRTEAVTNRLSLTLLLSAMAIALALAAGQGGLPPWMRYSANVLLLLVFLVAVWLFLSIVSAERRSKHRKQSGSGR